MYRKKKRCAVVRSFPKDFDGVFEKKSTNMEDEKLLSLHKKLKESAPKGRKVTLLCVSNRIALQTSLFRS